MNMNQVREKAKELGVKVKVGMTKIDAVRAIQRNEGNEDCFARGLCDTCGQTDCCFRTDCAKLQ